MDHGWFMVATRNSQQFIEKMSPILTSNASAMHLKQDEGIVTTLFIRKDQVLNSCAGIFMQEQTQDIFGDLRARQVNLRMMLKNRTETGLSGKKDLELLNEPVEFITSVTRVLIDLEGGKIEAGGPLRWLFKLLGCFLGCVLLLVF